ncbi:MAG: single-stranded-DNA-specific exonuclease RecJ [Clostridia bacterium]|nr:single-stranded-DNA-specific exonuclease RecJ [Clostridia bacterium]
MVLKKWNVCSADKQIAKNIMKEYKIDAFLSLLLTVRGIDTPDKIDEFFSKDLYLDDPFKLKDMDKAVLRIQKAIDNNEKICIYADYDADGITSCVMLYEYLQLRGAYVSYYVPNRFSDGYGLNNEAIQELNNNGIDLIITVDNGIVAFEQAKLISKLGMDLVVTDHHKQQEKLLPKACAVVNPHRFDCESKFKQLAGVGVTFKLVLALEGDESLYPEIFDSFFDLLCIGTVADIVSLTGENRNFVRTALRKFPTCERPGITALLEKLSLSKYNLKSSDIGFKIAPRINAAGRLDHTESAFELILCKDPSLSCDLAEKLCDLNLQRKTIENNILNLINRKLFKKPKILTKNRIIVVWVKDAHTGVIGIVASRLVAQYGKPVIVISVDETRQIAIGSGRSIKDFSLYDAVNCASHMLTKFGGHNMAVGFSMNTKYLRDFSDEVNLYAKLNHNIMPDVCVNIDAKINPSVLNYAFAEDIAYLEPFGEGNPKPIIGLFGLTVVDIIALSKGKHSKLILKRNSSQIAAFYFFKQPKEIGCKIGDVIDIAVNLEVTEFNNTSTFTTIITDLKYSKLDYDKILKEKQIYFKFINREPLDKRFIKQQIPSRADFGCVFKYLKLSSCADRKIDSFLNVLQNKNIGYFKFKVILTAMQELGILNVVEFNDEYTISINDMPQKANLDDAEILKYMKAL